MLLLSSVALFRLLLLALLLSLLLFRFCCCWFCYSSGDALTKIVNGNTESARRSKIHEYCPSNVLMRLTHHQYIPSTVQFNHCRLSVSNPSLFCSSVALWTRCDKTDFSIVFLLLTFVFCRFASN